MKQKTFDEEMKAMFGGKVYRLSLSSGCSCPNRDGTAGTGGCIFCSEKGSGDFCETGDIDHQIEEAGKRVAGKLSRNFAGYMAYFQSFTNTYGPVEKLKNLYEHTLSRTEILALSVATRPDCLGPEMIEMLSGLNEIKPVWVELGLQTVHEDTAAFIHRGYPLSVFEEAVGNLKKAGIRVVVHVIIGLPGEDAAKTKETVSYLSRLSVPGKDGKASRVDSVKLQILQVLKGTQLAALYEKDPSLIPSYSLEEYALLLKELTELLPEDISIHRLTGDPPKNLIITPLWTTDKKKVLNTIRKVLE